MARLHSVRHRLLLIALLPMVVILPLIVGVLVHQWDKRFAGLLSAKVGSDLKIADQYMDQLMGDQLSALTAIAGSARFQEALQEPGSRDALDMLLAAKARRNALDFIVLLDRDGDLLAGSQGMPASRLALAWPSLESAFAGRADVAVGLVTSGDLAALSPVLASRAEIRAPSSGSAAASGEAVERRGLMIQAATPVALPDGRTGALVAGTLLNHNTGFIERITNLIYRDNDLREGANGIASIFLGDVRIGTNATLPGGGSAVGTRASAEVSQAVLGQGRTWLDRAYVVDDWYVAGYKPIRDAHGAAVGMLFVGFSDQPFASARRTTIGAIVLGCLLVSAVTVPLFLRIARGVFRPLELMDETIGRVKEGERGARTGPVAADDEIGRVAAHLDRLLGDLQDSERQLLEWNEALNARVEERTAGLTLANQRLEETTRHLVMQEKLATIGEIAAGIAHEINNPLAVMQGNLELLRDAVQQGQGLGSEEEFGLIEDQIQRISTIVAKLLQFSRPGECCGHDELLEPAALMLETLPLVQHLTKRHPVAIGKQFLSTRLVAANRGEIQQILVNLMINAIHAMPDGGELLLTTQDADGIHGAAGVALRVCDTGSGIPAEVLARVFEPFFTTKHRQGTGLGLSISQMLATRHGGTLSVLSTGQNGTVMELWLPEAGADRHGDDRHLV